MSFILHPWQLLFLIFSGWVNRRQQEIIDFQNAQIKALMTKLGKKRILLALRHEVAHPKDPILLVAFPTLTRPG